MLSRQDAAPAGKASVNGNLKNLAFRGGDAQGEAPAQDRSERGGSPTPVTAVSFGKRPKSPTRKRRKSRLVRRQVTKPPHRRSRPEPLDMSLYHCYMPVKRMAAWMQRPAEKYRVVLVDTQATQSNQQQSPSYQLNEALKARWMASRAGGVRGGQ